MRCSKCGSYMFKNRTSVYCPSCLPLEVFHISFFREEKEAELNTATKKAYQRREKNETYRV